MPYASKEDMIARFGKDELLQITDRNQMGEIDDNVLGLAQLDGDGEINAFLRPQYDLPLARVPSNLVRLACDIYRYYLYGNLVPDYAQKRYDNAVKTLTKISQGKMDLNEDSSGTGAPPPDTSIHVLQGSAPAFSKDTLKNF
jgi:phage gp36-like protein